MEFNNEEMVKSLTSLIDETLQEIEEIKKSKFAASEISLGDDSSGIDGRSKNGKLEAKKKEDDEDDKDEDEEKEDIEKEESCKSEDEDEDEDDDMDKAEDKEDDEDDKDEDEDEEKEEKMSKGMGSDLANTKELKFPTKKELKAAKKPDAEGKKLAEKVSGKPLKKSEESEESLIKSYVDERFSTLEKTISKLASMIESIADAPAPRKSVPAGVTALQKSTSEVEPLSKSDVATKLFDLKKSGKQVDSMDIFKVETGNDSTVLEIANKYGLR